MVRSRSLFAAVVATALLAGCGGTATDAPPPPVRPTSTAAPLGPTSLPAAQTTACVTPSSGPQTVALGDTGGVTATLAFANYFAGAAACANVTIRTGGAAIVSAASDARAAAASRRRDSASNAPILSITVGDGLGSSFNRTSAVQGATLQTDPNLNFPNGVYDAVVTNTVAGVAFQQSLQFTAKDGVLTITAGAPAQFGALGTLALYAPGVVPPGFELFTPLPTSNPSGVPASSAPASPSPTPTFEPTVAPVTPSPSPSPSPSPTASPVYTTYGSRCTATESLPGPYTSVQSKGTISGSTYTQNQPTSSRPGGTWEVDTWNVPMGTPAPGVTLPAGTTVYEGTYVVPSFSGTGGSDNASFTSGQTTGCIGLIYNGGRSATDNTLALGDPQFTNPNASPDQSLGTGALTSMTVNNLSNTSGTGTFALDNGVTGTITIMGSIVITSSDAAPRGTGMRHPLR